MYADKIRGRNLVKSGRFPPRWSNEDWKRIVQEGGEGWHESAYYDYFLILNGRRAYSQSINIPCFTVPQFAQVKYLLGFQYENLGEGPEAKVVLKPSNGAEDPIDLSGKKKGIFDDEEWRPYEKHTVKLLQADTSIDLQIHGPTSGGSSGLRTTDFDLQIDLPELKLKGLTLDKREYCPTRSKADVKAVLV